ncbi:MAG: 2-hydroxyacid dehydrogenase [Flavobacteriaceae bacterium]
MKILILDNNHPFLKAQLIKNGHQLKEDLTSSKSDIENSIHLYDGVIIRSRFKIDKNFIDKATNLKFIARVGAGLESIDVAYASSKNIHLISAPEGNRNAVGEHALGMILSLFNNLKRVDNEIRNGQWVREANRGFELEGKTVGIIGYGNMGKAFAKKLKGFDTKVICYDIKNNVGDENAIQVSLNELFNETDVLSVHTPHNEISNRMIDTEFINQFKKPFYIINTGRGTAIVTDDLVEAMKQEKILGACLDVLEYEKLSFQNFFVNNNLPDAFQFLITSNKVLLSPHIAGLTKESYFKLAKTTLDKIMLFHKKSSI